MIFKKLFVFLALLTVTSFCFAQETTGDLQGTIKDPSGAVLPGARVTVSTPTLVGTKTELSDSKGYFHFLNLPPGDYTVVVDATGFKSLKRSGLTIEVGHSPTIDLTLSVGNATETVDVTSASAPLIDVTTTTTLTNVTADEIAYVPRGTSFQSVIQFAPSARNEPLMGNTMTNGSGSVSPGNGSNGQSFGYSIAGASDSENSYLVEGQETANLIGGYSHTNVPFDFIQEVEIKSSGVQAEYGGALGGVVNVIMKKGSPHYHGSVFAQFETTGLDAGLNSFPRYDPTSSVEPTNWVGSYEGYQGYSDATYQSYQPFKPKTMDIFPGFTLGGPLVPLGKWRDKVFFFVGFNPQLTRYENSVNYGPASAGNPAVGVVPFSQNTATYYTTARVDVQATKKIRVFGSWLYQLQKQYGENLPQADSIQGYYNTSSGNSPADYAHTLGYDAPNTTVNAGADITITPSIVSTSRFGYYFENYHDFGYPQGGAVYNFQTTGVGATDATGAPIPSSSPLYQNAGYQSGPLVQQTNFNSSKAIEVDQDFSWYKSTGLGTHNFKFGYQLNRNSNLIQQIYNEPYFQVFVGSSAVYAPGSPEGDTNCAQYVTLYGACQGKYGYVTVYDFGTGGKAIAYDNGFYGQDSWTIGKGLTLDYGLRLEKEYLPGEAVGNGAPAKPINFGWGDKIAIRVGGAWDVFQNGKLKVFGGFGQFYDQMKLNVAISSFGGQYWNNCVYALNTDQLSTIVPQFNSDGRYCPSGDTSTQALFTGGTTPAGLTFIENLNQRAFPTTCSTCSSQQEGVAPGLKPYEQHEALAGVDYQLSRSLAFEARYDRRRLDHVIEDAAVYNPDVGETFVIVNPGQGANASISSYCNFLYGAGNAGCVPDAGFSIPSKNPPAARSYDGIEFRLTKAVSNNWAGLFSYTYSKLRGNYTGLTSSDLSDGGAGGRNSPNNSRAFDEPYFQYNSFGQSSSGLLPTDRPNTLKGNAYYQLKWAHRFTTNFGIFQYFYQGSPNTSYTDVGLSYNAFPVKPFDWGKWANITQNQSNGAITVGTPYTYRNPWYIQTDFQIDQEYRINESMSVRFAATATNLLNEHAVTAVYSQIDSSYEGNQYITPQGQNLAGGLDFYGAATKPYDMQTSLNGAPINGQPSNNLGGPETINAQYGKPLYYQHPRGIRLSASFSF
jgi:outer membrane receptor protein involved in Fe transport